jgi:hypothetical protein
MLRNGKQLNKQLFYDLHIKNVIQNLKDFTSTDLFNKTDPSFQAMRVDVGEAIDELDRLYKPK